jgi:hypothetical protein
MSIVTPTHTDAGLILDGLADILELLPPPKERASRQERGDVIRVCRQLAPDVHPDTGQSFEAAKAYAGTEWSNALLRAMFGSEKARDLLLSRQG